MARQFNANAGAFGTSSSNLIRRCVAATLVLTSGLSGAAFAQSTGTEILEEELTEVTVSASRTIASIGNVTEQTAAKSRVTVTGESLADQSAGQTVLEGLNQVPGLVFTNNDPFGSSGGTIRLRGLDGSRVSLTFDGVQLNDSGNYAVFTNQLVDSELVDRVDVNLGTTDADSPTASATGGTIAIKTKRPAKEFGGDFVLSAGDESFRRMFGRVDTGTFGPLETKAFVSASYQQYDKWRGPGELEKKQINAMIFQEFDNGNFVSLAGHFNRNRNAQYRPVSLANFQSFGREFDNLAACTIDTATAGVADNNGATPVSGANPAENPLNPSACTNYFGLRLNPSDTGNIRGQSLFNLGEQLRLTIDAAYQYTLANGGGTTLLTETPVANNADRRVVGNTGLAGFDLNGDGDPLDTVRFYTPNNTNTNRWGGTASLIWDISDSHRVRMAYTYERARHRQTAEWGRVDDSGNPLDVFAGREGPPVLTADGSLLRGRDRYSVALLNQVAAEYRGEFFDERVIATVGVRAPRFERELNQYCYTPNGGTGSSGAGGALCTTQQPVATRPNGNVVFVNSATAVQYIAPYAAKVKFDDVLPNLGLTFKPIDNHLFYVSYAEGISAPRTDNLYSVSRVGTDPTIRRSSPESETTRSYDLGWRYSGDSLLATVAVWRTDYKNRIVSAFDPELGANVDRNVGSVMLQGIDFQAGWRVDDKITITGFASYNDSELKDNVQVSAISQTAPLGVFLPTQGKTFVETPDVTVGGQFDFNVSDKLRLSIDSKHVGRRYATDVNDVEVDAYTVWGLFARYKVEFERFKDFSVQLNVDNLFDEEYFGSINSSPGVTPQAPPFNFGAQAPTFQIGFPRTVTVSVKMSF
jgi:iron complex outermembrane recepter protein